MIIIRNTQRTININTDMLKRDAARLLKLLNYGDYDLGIWITTDKTIRRYNAQYRHKDAATDILSFPYHTALKAGERIELIDNDDKNLGDLIISAEYVQRTLQEHGLSLHERMRVLLVHGICHLLGYDHIQDADYEIMAKKEHSLLKQLHD